MAAPVIPGALNEQFLRELLDAQAAAHMAEAKAETARANVSTIRAKIEAAGKQISYDYQNGRELVRVIDRPLA